MHKNCTKRMKIIQTSISLLEIFGVVDIGHALLNNIMLYTFLISSWNFSEFFYRLQKILWTYMFGICMHPITAHMQGIHWHVLLWLGEHRQLYLQGESLHEINITNSIKSFTAPKKFETVNHTINSTCFSMFKVTIMHICSHCFVF